MKAVVTGGAGFIGSHIVDMLIDLDFDVAVIDNLETGLIENVNEKAIFYCADIRDEKTIHKIFDSFRPDYVFHYAAQMDVRRSMHDPFYDLDVNVFGSLNIIKFCLEFNVKKIIYASSGGTIYGEPLYTPTDEKHPLNPESAYGISKHTVTHYLFMYGKWNNLNYTVFNLPNVYGPRQRPDGEAGVTAIFIGKMLKGESPLIFGDGNTVRDYLFISDVISANEKALEYGDQGIYNLGWGVGISVNEIFNTIKELLNFTKRPIYTHPRPGEISTVCLSSALARKELGWKPEVELIEGLKLSINWQKELIGVKSF